MVQQKFHFFTSSHVCSTSTGNSLRLTNEKYYVSLIVYNPPIKIEKSLFVTYPGKNMHFGFNDLDACFQTEINHQ